MTPIKLLILALGGEGGAVLADWLVEAAQREHFAVQSTSIPGVAQRTGATSYYIELWPRADSSDALEPVFCLSPSAGDLDLLVSSELLETARALERGLPDAQRSVLISSTNRFFTVAEKSALGDGRFDDSRTLAAAQAMCREALLFDMNRLAREAGTAVSSVMFGAIYASGVTPLSRTACESVIRGSGKSAAASLAGFARAVDEIKALRATRAALAAADAPRAAQAGSPQPGAPDSIEAGPAPGRAGEDRSLSLDATVELGRARVRDFQDQDYVELYQRRVERVRAAEAAAGGHGAVARDAARYLALWMAYDDVIRVADLKSRPQRFARIRADFGAEPDQPVIVRDYLKPGVEELAAVLPGTPARLLRRLAGARSSFGTGFTLNSSSVHGRLLLRGVAAAQRWRRRSVRYREEQAMIERWLAAIERHLVQAAAADAELKAGLIEAAHAIAGLPRLLKGFGDTWARGRQRFETIFATLVETPTPADSPSASARAASIARALSAALAEPDGRSLAAELGMPAPATREQPLRFVPMRRRRAADTL